MAVLVADLVKKLHSNIDSIHQTIQSLSDTTSHDAELDRLSRERDAKVQGLRKGHEDTLKALRAQREKEALEMMEKRKKEEEELEAERRREYEELMARRAKEDADRKKRIEEQEREWERIKAEEDRERERQRDQQEKSLQDTVEAELEKLEDEMERKVEEGKKALQELDENRRAINAQIEEALYAPSVIPKIHFRSRAKTIGQPAIDDGQKESEIPKENKLTESHTEKAIDQPTTAVAKSEENVENQSKSQIMANVPDTVSIEQDKARSLNVDSAVGQPAQMNDEISNNPIESAEGNFKHGNGDSNAEDSAQVESEISKNLDMNHPNGIPQQGETGSGVESPIEQSARTDDEKPAEYPDSLSQQHSSGSSNSSPSIQNPEQNSPNEKIETMASQLPKNEPIKEISSIEIENPNTIPQVIPAIMDDDDSGPHTEPKSIHETSKTPLNEATNSIVALSAQDQGTDLPAQTTLNDSTSHDERSAQDVLSPLPERSVELLTPANKSKVSEKEAIPANPTILSPEISQSAQTSHDPQPTAEPSDEAIHPEDIPLPAATPNTEHNLQFNSAIAPADPSQRLEQDFLTQDEESLERLEEKVGNFQEEYLEHESTDSPADSPIHQTVPEESSNEHSAILSQRHPEKSVLHNEKAEIPDESSGHEQLPQTVIFEPKIVNHITSPSLPLNENHDGSLSSKINAGTTLPPLLANSDFLDDEDTQNSLEKMRMERLEVLKFPRLRNRGAFNRDLAAIHGFNSSGSSDGSRSSPLNQTLEASIPEQTNTMDVLNVEALKDGKENDFAAEEEQVKHNETRGDASFAEHTTDGISSTTSQNSSDNGTPTNLDTSGNNSTPRDVIPFQDGVHLNQDIQNVDPNSRNKELDSNSSDLKHRSESQTQSNHLDCLPSTNEQGSHALESTSNAIAQELVKSQELDSKDAVPSNPNQPDAIMHATAPASPIAPARTNLTPALDSSEQAVTNKDFDSKDDSPSSLNMKSGRTTPEKPILKSESSPQRDASTPPKKVQFQDSDSLDTNTKSIHLPPDFDVIDTQEQPSQHERDQGEDAQVPQSNMANSDTYEYEDYSPTPTREVFTMSNEEMQSHTSLQDSWEHSTETAELHTAESPVTGADANDLFDDDEDDVPRTPIRETPQKSPSITSPVQQSSPIQSRWAQLRKNAAERAAATRNIEQTSTNEPEQTTPVGRHFLDTVTQETVRSPNSSKSETTSGGDETDDFQSVSEFPNHSRTQSDEMTQSFQTYDQADSAAQRSRSATTDSMPSYAHSDGNSIPSSPSEAPSSPFQEIPGDEPAISSSWQSPGRVADPRENSPALKSEALPLSGDFDPYNPQSYPSYISPTVNGANINDSKRAHRADLTPLITQKSPQPSQENESPILPANESQRPVSQTSTASPTRIPRRSLNSNRTSSPINPATTSFFQKTRQLFEAPITTAHQASHARTSSPRPLSGLFYSSSASPSPNSKPPTSFHSTKPPVSPYDETKDGEEPEIIPRSLDRDGRAPSPVYSLPTPPPPPPKDLRASTQSTQGSFFGGLGKWVGTGGLDESIYNPNRRTPEGQPLIRSGLTGGPRRGRSQSGYDGEGYGN